MQNETKKITPRRVFRELGIWSIIAALFAGFVGWPALYLYEHPEMLATYPAGTPQNIVTVPVVTHPATGTVTPIGTPELFLIATMTHTQIIGARGIVIAPEAVEIRDYPEGAGLESQNVGYLYPGESIAEIDCQYVGPSVWVRHALGWSIVRNASSEFITGVCQ